MALKTALRTYFASAFTGKYYEQAEGAFEALKALVSDPTTKFYQDAVHLQGDDVLECVSVGSSEFRQKFPKLTVAFVDRAELRKQDNSAAFLNDYHNTFLHLFKSTQLFVMVLGIPTGGAPITVEMIRAQMKSSRLLKHLFVHEYVHYAQRNRFLEVLLPLATLRDNTPYQQRWDEIEAWNVETFSRFLAKAPRSVKLEVINDIDRFELAFMKFITEHHKQGAGFFMQMTEMERGRFIRESFDLLRKKMAATTQGT